MPRRAQFEQLARHAQLAQHQRRIHPLTVRSSRVDVRKLPIRRPAGVGRVRTMVRGIIRFRPRVGGVAARTADSGC